MIPQGKLAPCGSGEVLVSVTSYRNGILTGRLWHPRLERAEEIQSLSQMILLLKGLIDLEDCPGQPLPVCTRIPDRAEGASFRIQILFREHYTWQGRLIWENEDREAVFHSGIELIGLLDEILAE